MDTELKAGGRLERVLRSGRFAVTAELNPPDSADPEDVYRASREGVLCLGCIYKCDKCEHWHPHLAGGVLLTEGIRGSWSNVVGLPLESLPGWLERIGIDLEQLRSGNAPGL